MPFVIDGLIGAAAVAREAIAALGRMRQEPRPITTCCCCSRFPRLAEQINDGISKHGVVEHPTHGKIYAYEVR